jgi:hypothetical protein
MALGPCEAEKATRLKIVKATSFIKPAYSIFLESVRGFLTSDTRNEKGKALQPSLDRELPNDEVAQECDDNANNRNIYPHLRPEQHLN